MCDGSSDKKHLRQARLMILCHVYPMLHWLDSRLMKVIMDYKIDTLWQSTVLAIYFLTNTNLKYIQVQHSINECPIVVFDYHRG